MLIVSPETGNSYLVSHLYITGGGCEREKEHSLRNRLGFSGSKIFFS